MSGNKNKKGLRNKKTSKGTRIFAVICVSVVALVALIWSITAVVSSIKKKNADKTVRIAFYGLSEELYTLLEERIPKEEKINLKCDILSDGALDLGALKEKYDMIFTWKGEVTDSLEESSEDIPKNILENLPSTLQNKKCVPILLDHCEFTYNIDIITKTTESIPSNFAAFLNYLNQSKGYAFSPFFCHGGDDRVLCAFIGSLVEAQGGFDAYSQLISELRKGTDFETLLDVELNSAGFTLRSVLNMLKTWPKEGYTHPGWFNGSGNDLENFAEKDYIAVFFTYLSEHRKIPYKTISKYEASYLPLMSYTSKFGIIAPSISAMLLSENENAKRYLSVFFTQEAQEELSLQTKLAPVHSRAQACDRQADDVRYWAASCPGGALPDLYLAVFQRKPAKMSEFAANCRSFVR